MEKQKRTELQEQRDQFTVVLEDIQTHNRAFGDMLLGVREKVDRLETRFDGLEAKVDRMAVRLDATFEEVGRLREDITEMNEKKADKSDLITLGSRVSRLELSRQ
mgnify:CR=1 FL=1